MLRAADGVAVRLFKVAKLRYAQFAGCVPGMGNNLGVKVPYRLGSGNC
jgi:hypothetical protein